jgi:hypothetical protein
MEQAFGVVWQERMKLPHNPTYEEKFAMQEVYYIRKDRSSWRKSEASPMSRELADKIVERYQHKNPSLIELDESVRYRSLIGVGEEQPPYVPPIGLVEYEQRIRKCLADGITPRQLFTTLTQVVFNH